MGPLPTMSYFGGLTFKAVAVALVLIVAQPIELAQAQFMNGATLASCVSLTEPGFTPQPAGTNPFRITFSQSFYRPGDVIQVTFDSATVQTFTGFICQARYTNGDTTPVGSFSNQNINDYQTLSCSSTDDTITNTGSTPKTLPVTFTWRAPQTDSTQEVAFVISVVLPNGQFYESSQSLPLAASATGLCPNDILAASKNGQAFVLFSWTLPDRPSTIVMTNGPPSTAVVVMVGVALHITYQFENTVTMEMLTCGFILTAVAVTNNPPVATCPAYVTVFSLEGDFGAFVEYNTVCSDIEDPAGSIMARCYPQTGSFFQGLGITAVHCTCTDSAGVSNSCVFNVNVLAFVPTNIPPLATCPADVNVVSFQGNIGSFAKFDNAVCSDSEDPAGSIIASCDPQTDSFFQGLGNTAVNCTCTDSAGASNSCEFNVFVLAFVLTNIPPVATCPADVTVVSVQGNIGIVANFSNAVCSDSEDPAGSIIASCDRQTGSFFQGLGITAVTCTCTDSAGASNSCVFNVNVMPFVLGSPSELRLLIILVPIILLSVLCLVILAICLSCRRKRKRAKQQNIQLQPLPKPSVSEIQTDDDYETADVGNETVNYNGDSVVYHRSGVVLSNRLQSSGRIIRWIASLRNTGRRSFVASTLSENSSRNDKREYRLFAEHLRNMPRHKNVVDTIGCDTNEVPYFIYTEYVMNGRLKDYLKGISEANSTYTTSIYTEGEGSKSLDSQNKQLATFAIHVLEALIFLESVDCDHPGLSAGKVLLDANNNCKLYDFNLCSTTSKIISQLQFEGSSRLQWYAPETIFNREYAETSDVWSYALFLWEVFSLGQNPFENLDSEGIKSAIHIQPVLPQTKCCPNMIYSLIKNCLQIEPERRVKFPDLRDSLQQFIGGSAQVASKEYR